MLSDAEYVGGKFCSNCDATGMAANPIYSKWNILCESLSRQETKNSTVSAFEEGGGVLLQVLVRQWNTILVGRLEWNIPEFYSFIHRQNTAERFITVWERVIRLWKLQRVSSVSKWAGAQVDVTLICTQGWASFEGESDDSWWVDWLLSFQSDQTTATQTCWHW